jgi:site-specific DNA-methyltransferase (adenine-specific)
MELYNEDCLGDNGLCKIADKSIDMILCDPPYAITANKWDNPLDLEKMFKHYDRIIKDNGAIVLFGNQPFTTDIINAYRKNLRYSLVWDKNLGTDFFNCNRKPLKSHEDIIVFYKKQPTYNPQKEEGQKHYKNIRKPIDISHMQDRNFRFSEVIENKDGTRYPKSVIKVEYTEHDEYEMEEHEDIIVFYKKQPTYNPQKEEGKPYNKTMQGECCSSSGVNRLTERNINDGTRFPKSVIKVEYTEHDEYEMEEHEDIIVFYKKQPTYNPQKEEGKPYNRGERKENASNSGIKRLSQTQATEGRYPKSILKYKRETGKHTTQKPVKLCEWLIKTYTNEGETVLDNTMGSGTTGVACKNTGRKFIGFELDKKYFETAKERLGLTDEATE